MQATALTSTCLFCLPQIERVRADYGDDAVETCFAGFYFSEANNGIRFYCLALPRDEKGRVTARVKGRKTERPRFFRLIRPATGFVAGDVPWMVSHCTGSRLAGVCKIPCFWLHTKAGFRWFLLLLVYL